MRDKSRPSWFRRKLTVLLVAMTPRCRAFRTLLLASVALGSVALIPAGVLYLLPFTREWVSDAADPTVPASGPLVAAFPLLGVFGGVVLLGYVQRREWAAPVGALWWCVGCGLALMSHDLPPDFLVLLWATGTAAFMVPHWARQLTGDEELEWWPIPDARQLREVIRDPRPLGEAIGHSLRRWWAGEVANAREEARQVGRAFLLGCLIAGPFALYAWGTGQRAHHLWRDIAADVGARAEWSLADYASERHLIVRVQGSGHAWHVQESGVLWRTPGQPLEPADAQFMVGLHTLFGELPAVFVHTGPGGTVVIGDAGDLATRWTISVGVWIAVLFVLGPLIEFLRSRRREPEGGDRIA